jgi:hypothetical protein
MILLKLHFFNLLGQSKSNSVLLEIYNNHITPIVFFNVRKLNNLIFIQDKFVNVGNYLNCITMNPQIVKSRIYHNKFEEVCRIFLIALDRALVNIYFQNDSDKYADPQHTCVNLTYNCPVCIDYQLLENNWEKICIFEEELWVLFIQNKEYFQEQDVIYPTHLTFKEENSDTDFFNYLENNYYENEKNNNFFNEDEQLEKNLILETTQTNSLSCVEFSCLNLKEKQHNFDYSSKSKLKFLVHKQGQSNMEEISFSGNQLNESTTNSKKQHKKLKLSFFKDFNFKFTKRENIDKSILRKSRKFLKEKVKKNKLDFSNLNLNAVEKNFWTNFIKCNLLPPMNYTDEETGRNFEFKSFNTGYIIWLFSHKGAEQIFEFYLQENFNDIFEKFVNNFSLKDDEEINMLSYYIKNLPKFYCIQNSDQSSKISSLTENISLYSEKIYYEDKKELHEKEPNHNYDIINDIQFFVQ